MGVTVPSSVSTTNVDSSADIVANARADFLDHMQKFNTLIGQINALGIMQIGDGLTTDAQGAGTKDKLKILLDGGAASGLAVSASGIKVAAQGISTAMISRSGGSSGQILTHQGAGADPTWAAAPATGEANTVTNVGTGVAMMKTKSGVDIPARTWLNGGIVETPIGTDNGTGFYHRVTGLSFAVTGGAGNEIEVKVLVNKHYFSSGGGGGM